jgi:hypothetical protein
MVLIAMKDLSRHLQSLGYTVATTETWSCFEPVNPSTLSRDITSLQSVTPWLDAQILHISPRKSEVKYLVPWTYGLKIDISLQKIPGSLDYEQMNFEKYGTVNKHSLSDIFIICRNGADIETQINKIEKQLTPLKENWFYQQYIQKDYILK